MPSLTKTRPAMADADRITNWHRLVNTIIGLLYTVLFRQVYWSYISLEWGYTGLIFKQMSFMELSFMYGMIAVVSWFVPVKVRKPSSVIIWFLYAIIYVPTMSITLMIGSMPASTYMSSLLALSAGIIIISKLNEDEVERIEEGEPGSTFVEGLLVVFVVLSGVIFYTYRDIMVFASIDDVYVQRFIAADLTSGLGGYIRSYYASFVAPLLIAIGIANRSRVWLVPLGVVGFIMSYMIDASKISLVIPIVMIVSGMVFRWKGLRFYHMTAGMLAICSVSAALTSSTKMVRFIADLVLLRTVSIPAQTFAQYFDVFYQKGYTWWSNITGLSLVLPVPVAFQSDQFWPVLGQIVGAEYYGFASRVNLNANPFVGEGVAAAGWAGVLVISCAIGMFLYALDRFSAGWNRLLVLVLMVPIGLTLTNVHLSTFLVSFGGLAWLLLLKFYKPAQKGPSGVL